MLQCELDSSVFSAIRPVSSLICFNTSALNKLRFDTISHLNTVFFYHLIFTKMLKYTMKKSHKVSCKFARNGIKLMEGEEEEEEGTIFVIRRAIETGQPKPVASSRG